ncbi:MAG: hypothetical protein EXX96DRAFT_567625 [Benjaminiella poitrasii]|nr:MAG: hypothetical protein EXX96DRAFT_567625 [Benjaminiella poitrasii]
MQIKFLSLALLAVTLVSAITPNGNKATIVKDSTFGGNEVQRLSTAHQLIVAKREEPKKVADAVVRRRHPAPHQIRQDKKLKRRNGLESGLMSDGFPIVGNLLGHNKPKVNKQLDYQDIFPL